MFRRASGAKSAENEFAIANDPFTQGALGRLGHVVPFYVLNISASVADEVMMQQAFGIESRGAALDRHFTHQACLHQVTQIVISGGLEERGSVRFTALKISTAVGCLFCSIKKAITA